METNREDVRIKVTDSDIAKKKQQLVYHKLFHNDIPINVREYCVERAFDDLVYPNIDPSDGMIKEVIFNSPHLLNRAFRHAKQEYKIDRGDEEKLDGNYTAKWLSKLDQVVQRIDLERALNSLSPIEHYVIQRRYYDDMTCEQVAEKLRAVGLQPGTGPGVGRMCERICMKLRKILASDD